MALCCVWDTDEEFGLFILCAGGVSELCGMRFGGHKGPPKRKKKKK